MEQNPEQQPGSGGGADNSSHEKQGIADAINVLKRSYEASNEHQREHDRQSLIWTRRTAKAAIAYTTLTVLTFAAAVAAAIFAGKGAYHAGEQAEIARQTLVTSQRAYVYIARPFFRAGKKSGGQVNWPYTIPLENGGNTPTGDVFHVATFIVFDHPVPMTYPFPDIDLPIKFTSVIAPHHDIKQVFDISQTALQEAYPSDSG